MMEEPVINTDLSGEAQNTFRYFPFFNNKQPVFVIILLGIIFYCTSLYNEYALDDGIVIHQNNYVLKGVRGIKDILSKDLYDAFYRRMNATDQLQGGRYHPLPVISYAIEQEIIGAYRTGYYQFVEDINQNGVLDHEKTSEIENTANRRTSANLNTNVTKTNESDEKQRSKSLHEYEYNRFTDTNSDGVAQENECNNCWDSNSNFHNDPAEDLNADGIFNEVDCQVKGAFLRHFNNMLFYIIACVLLYRLFSRYFFKDRLDMAFLAALIFLVHPVHSEVVANVKSRDEIFSIIFIALTFLYSFKFLENRKISTLLTASCMFLLALLSKEYSIMLLLLLPLAIYIFNKTEIKKTTLFALLSCFVAVFIFMIGLKLSLGDALPGMVMAVSGTLVFAGVIAIFFRSTLAAREMNALMAGLFTFGLLYMGMRLNAVSIAAGVPDTEILNDPYLLANGEEKFATKIFILLKYLVLAFFPKNLTSDYSYASITYRHFSDADFILSLVANTLLVVLGIFLALKKHVMGFALITYYAFLLLVTNFLFAIGTTMHEGFLFHASIGIAIAFAWLILTGIEKIQAISLSARRSILLGSLIVLLFLYGYKTWERNWDWKNDVTLFLKDVKRSPNSVLILGNAGARWIDLADTKEITGYAEPGASKIYNDYNGTLKITDEELKESGYETKREAALYRGIGYLKHAVELHPRYVNGYLNLGLASYKLNKNKDAIYYWKIAEYLYPNNPYLQNYYSVYSNILMNRGALAFENGNFREAAVAYNYWTIVDPTNAKAWYYLGGSYYNLGRFKMANKAWRKALNINPGYEEVKKVMKQLPEEFREPPQD